MATRHAKSRPHCVDLVPSAYANRAGNDAYATGKRSSSGRSAGRGRRDSNSRSNRLFGRLFGDSTFSASPRPATGKGASVARGLIATSPRGQSLRQADVHTGAIRRSTEAGTKHSSRHYGKLAAASLVIAGAVIWTSGATETLVPSLAEKPDTIKAAVITPAFFFEDLVDALDRNTAQVDVEANNTEPLPVQSDKSVEPSIVVAMTSMHDNDTFRQFSEKPTTRPKLAAPTTASVAATLTGQAIDSALPASETRPTQALLTEAPKPPQASGLQKVTVAMGDTLSGILNENGLKVEQMHELLSNDLIKDHLSNIDVGQVFELMRDDAGAFQSLTTRVGNDRRVIIDRTNSGFNVSTVELPVERRRVATSGRIEQSLYLAAERANLKQSTIMELANIFQWELDFARDIRHGDSFSLVYDRLFREGEYIGDGDILAAEFVRGGKSYKAIRFTTDDGISGYYSPEGQSKRRTFMRHPVDVVRITSKFNPNRLHPVLHQIRAHRGVDYGSPHGSPIYATADGRVIFSGDKNAYGKTVVLKHGEKFSTLYAHMSRISSKSQVGKRVKQGDVIGYVGKTGRVTGTHLHYEFRVNGKQIDPLKVELPAAAPLNQQYLPRLKTLAEEMSSLMAQALQDVDDQVAAGPAPELITR